MGKKATKKFVENNGFICNKCGKVVVDGHKHKNEEDLCDQCKIADLETKLAESESESNARYSAWQEEIGECDRLRVALAEYEAIKKKYKTIFLDRFVDAKVEDARIWKEKYDQLKQQLADNECDIASAESVIDDLKIELVEKDKVIENLRTDLKDWQDLEEKLGTKYDKVVEQLAEKDAEIEELNHKLNVEQPCLLINYKDMVDVLKKSQNQTAISELEEVKQLCDGIMLSEKIISNQNTKPFQSIINYIDKQIKELKGGK